MLVFLSLFFTISQKCTTNLICFFCIFGEFTVKAQKRSLTPLVKKTYELHFGRKCGDPDNLWPPDICCGTCASKINKWMHCSRPSIHFAVPMVWCKQKAISGTVISLWPMWKISLHSRRTVFSTRICPRQYGHSHMWVSAIPKPPIDWNFDKEA